MSEVEVLPQRRGRTPTTSTFAQAGLAAVAVPAMSTRGRDRPAAEIKQWGDPGTWGRSPQAV